MKGKVKVRNNNQDKLFGSLEEFIRYMQSSGILTAPVKINKP